MSPHFVADFPNEFYGISEPSNINFTKKRQINESTDSKHMKIMKKIGNRYKKQRRHKMVFDTTNKEETNESQYIQNNKIDCENISQIENNLIIKHHNTISESKNKINVNSNISVDEHKDNNEMVDYINNLINIVCYFSDQKYYSPDKINNSSESNSSYLSTSINNPQIRKDTTKTMKSNDNEFNQSNKVTCDNSQLRRLSSLENSNDDSHMTGQISNDLFQTKNNLNKLNTEKSEIKNDDNTSINSHVFMMSKNIKINKRLDVQNTNDIQMKSSNFDDCNNEINSESSSHEYHSPNINVMTNHFKCVKKISKMSFSKLESILDDESLTFIMFEKKCSAIVFEMMMKIFPDKPAKNYDTMIIDLNYVQNVYDLAKLWLDSIKCIIKKHKMDLKHNVFSHPHCSTRTVGTQFGHRKNGILSVPNILENLPVMLLDDDDDDDDDDDNGPNF